MKDDGSESYSRIAKSIVHVGPPDAMRDAPITHDAVPFETHLTDTGGRAIFVMPQTGRWLLNVIWTRSLPSSSETDFETVLSSLRFGFSDDRRVGG